ncbi:exodeoxyribonuclease V subunit beta [Salinicola sp. CPA57]|uniref:exodeoxyribonuclease V subunit beta n=1 Tax=Salinicola sp. CPA57 TaxID=1949080 RepID=UPI000DA22C31|nr:exodeoxyribonuclease V subunit beta [Salinicola sp. CPA57]
MNDATDGNTAEETVPLELVGLPLTGPHLIEASAGTGKTFTLAALYVRLVLGPLPGREAVDFPRPLTPPEILVVTFTEAATAELRGRIRARLKQARDWLLSGVADRQDPVLADLLAPLATAGETACRSGARRLDQAARLMDEAAIFTIHGFCQRMLTRHAFDAGARFSAELLQDGQTLLTQAVEDYWRCEFYPLDERWQRQIRAQWSGPEALASALRPLLKDGEPQPLWVAGEAVESPPSLTALFAELESGLDQRESIEAALIETWDRDVVASLMAEAFRNGVLNKSRFKAEELEERLAGFENWLAQGEFDATEEITDSSGRFWLSQEKLEGAVVKTATQKGHAAPAHPFFGYLDRLEAHGRPFDAIARQVLVHARDRIAVSFAADKRRQGLWEFSDLLNDLDAALARPAALVQPPGGGEAAKRDDSAPLRLAARIRHELPVALIDEFQDTDPVQYRIFSNLYRAPESDPATTAFLMIGDPKQAIYAFRGADIHTYLRARRATPSRFTLMRNFRSTQAMVEATNALFQRHPRPFGSDEIPFVAVESNPKSTQLVDRDGRPVEALGVWWPDTERHTRNDYQNVMASTTRAEVQRLLEGQWRFEGAHGERPVQPADIAILVRHGGEALKVRSALAEGGIRSVYLSERSSVFDTPQAFELLQLFEAVAQPRQDARLKAALATKLLNESPQALEPLLADELAWEREVERFSDYHRQWQRRGVLPMLRTVMRDFRIAERLALRVDGERALTDLLHLGELAQNAQQRLDGEQALLRWWHRALQEGVETLDSQALSQRLESDEDLVRVITVHKSKGLEYPIVLLPFICSHRPAEPDRQTGLLALRPPKGEGSVLVASPDDAQKREADLARLDEDVRLLYVALTRAAFACRLGVAQVGRGRGKSGCLHETALGRLLGSDKADDGAALLERLREGQRAGWLAIEPLPEMPDHRLRMAAIAPPTKPARIFDGQIDDDWWIASYTSLIADARRATGDEDAAAAGEDLPATLDIEVSRERDPIPRPSIRTLLDFPRGPRPGTFLHGLLEMLDFDRLGDPDYAATVRRDIERRLAMSGFDADWAPLLQAWLLERLRLPLVSVDGHTVRLDRLEAWRTELEFWLPATAAWSEPLDRLVTRLEPLPGQRPRLAPRKLNGMLKGYIDLVFEANGRWYVLDWKSNHLGDDPADYQGERLAAAMVEHRYDLQYVLYVLALHRLLKSRLEDYDYERHMGGACYVFLRGLSELALFTAPEAAPRVYMAPEVFAANGVFHRRPDRALIEALDAWLEGNPEPARALLRQPKEIDR